MEKSLTISGLTIEKGVLSLVEKETINEAIRKRLDDFNRNEKRHDLENALDTVKDFILDLFDYLNEEKGE